MDSSIRLGFLFWELRISYNEKNVKNRPKILKMASKNASALQTIRLNANEQKLSHMSEFSNIPYFLIIPYNNRSLKQNINSPI